MTNEPFADSSRTEQAERKEQLPIVERCVSLEAQQALARFCEAHPQDAERLQFEAKKTVEILSDLNLEKTDDPEWRCVFDATYLRTITDYGEASTEALNSYNPEHKFLTMAVLADMETLDGELDALRQTDPSLVDKMQNGLTARWGMTPLAFKDKFDYADARTLDRKIEHICPQAALANASRLLYRLNRTRNYSPEQAFKDIVNAESVFVPLFEVGRDAFSMALADSAEIARMDRCGLLGRLDKARYILGETFGEIKEGVHQKAIGQLFNGLIAKHTTEDGEEHEGLSVRSVVGYASGEHSVVFCTMQGEIAGVKVRGRFRGKGLISTYQKLQKKEYKDLDIHDPKTWPQDLLGVVLIVGDKSEDESPTVDMAAEERNVKGVARILKHLVTYIGLDSTPELAFQASASRGHAVHIRGDSLYVEGMKRETGFTEKEADIKDNNDHSYQVAKVTVGIAVDAHEKLVNTEIQVMTRRARKNSREGTGAHWLLKKVDAIKRKLDPDQTLDKHADVLTPMQRRASSAYIEKIKNWLRSKVGSDYNTLRGASEYCERRGIVLP